MRLLDKFQINTSKALERKLEVDEGKKLAGSVDALRELQSKEQSSLSQWRDAAMSQAKRDIGESLAELAGVRSQIATAQQQRDALNKPLTDREREIDLKDAKLNQRVTELDERELAIRIKEGTVGTKEQDLNVKEVHLNELETGTISLNLEAQRREKEARTLLRDAEKTSQAAKDYKAAVDADIGARQVDLAARENAADLRQNAQDREEVRLSLRERAIIDREEQLEREINRNKNV